MSSRLRAAWLLACSPLLVTCACGDDDEVVPADAGQDASGFADGGTDAGEDDPYGWTVVYQRPDGKCPVERALRPGDLARQEWVQCDGIDGCLALRPDAGWSRIAFRQGGTKSGSTGVFAMVQEDVSLPRQTRPQLVVFARVGTERPLAALRTTPGGGEDCALGVAKALGSDGILKAPTWSSEAVLRVSYEHDTARLVGNSETRGLNSIQSLWPADDFVVGLRAPPIALVTWDAAGREVVFTGPGSDLEGGPSSSVTVLEPWTYWIQAVDFVGTLMRRSTDGRVESLDPFPGTSVFAFWSGGETAVWFTSVDRETGTADLWSGAYDEDPNRWEPRRLLRTSEDIVSGLGGENTFAAMWSGTPIRLSFFHLGRRTVRELVLPEDMVVWADPVYVSDTEVMLRDRYGWDATAYRFDLTALPERALDAAEPE